MELTLVDFGATEQDISYFTEGQCNALAYHIHLITGWSLAMLSDQKVGSEDYCGHVFVIDSQGMAIDITGRQSLETIYKQWDFLPYIHRFFTLKDFQLEMSLWDNKIHYTRDIKAKMWARKIVDMLR